MAAPWGIPNLARCLYTIVSAMNVPLDNVYEASFSGYQTYSPVLHMGYDLSSFFENKLSKELRQYRRLEDKEKQIEMKIKEVQESIDELKELLSS